VCAATDDYGTARQRRLSGSAASAPGPGPGSPGPYPANLALTWPLPGELGSPGRGLAVVWAPELRSVAVTRRSGEPRARSGGRVGSRVAVSRRHQAKWGAQGAVWRSCGLPSCGESPSPGEVGSAGRGLAVVWAPELRSVAVTRRSGECRARSGGCVGSRVAVRRRHQAKWGVQGAVWRLFGLPSCREVLCDWPRVSGSRCRSCG
jgi:hypothetical protein